MLYRSLYQHSSLKTVLKLYLTKIRPHLEYASPVWDPFHKGEIEELENVQKFALRMCLKSWDMDYSELLEKAHIPTLSSRRSRASLQHLTKIVKNQTYIYFPEAPITVRQNPYFTRTSKVNTLVVPRANSTSHKFSFFPKTLALWNSSNIT